MIIVCFIYSDNSLFWPLYGYIPNDKTFLFSYVRMKNPLFKSENIKEKINVFFRVNCVKIVYLLDIFNRPTIGISVVLLPCKSSRCTIRAQGCCALVKTSEFGCVYRQYLRAAEYLF